MGPEDLLRQGLKDMRLKCSETRILAFMKLMRELKRWNQVYSLTAITSDSEIIIKHFLDSLLYLKLIPNGSLKIADAGSGAGFPGIPIAIMRPASYISLIESSRKKTAFLRHVIRNLHLQNINVIEARIEDLRRDKNMVYDVIVSRATFKIRDILRIVATLQSHECMIVLSKGPGLFAEIEELEKIPAYAHLVQKVLKVTLPFSEDRRNLVLLRCIPSSQDA